MAKQEQKDLADFVKQVHLSLRCKSREIGAEKAWEEHLKNEEVLRKYASSMKKLAEDYWSVNNQSETDKVLCRIEWMMRCVIDYFEKGGLQKELEKEQKKMELFVKKELVDAETYNCFQSSNFGCQGTSPYRLLDVGSCYNPFGKFNFLEVYPIDLHPAIPEVKKCNFIQTDVRTIKTENWFHDNLSEIPSAFFDVVVFSLFLEYLPQPKQRYNSCVKAYECLKINGLLLIVTPDSKHATANASVMKSWKISAAQIGFVRIRLEKLKHLYCMAFRKSAFPNYPLLLYNVKIEDLKPEEMFVIPQDSVDYKVESKSCERSEEEDDFVTKQFQELPFS